MCETRVLDFINLLIFNESFCDQFIYLVSGNSWGAPVIIMPEFEIS